MASSGRLRGHFEETEKSCVRVREAIPPQHFVSRCSAARDSRNSATRINTARYGRAGRGDLPGSQIAGTTGLLLGRHAAGIAGGGKKLEMTRSAPAESRGERDPPRQYPQFDSGSGNQAHRGRRGGAAWQAGRPRSCGHVPDAGLTTKKEPAWCGLSVAGIDNSYSRLAPPQLVLPLVVFHTPAAVVALVQAGWAAAPSVGAVAPLPW